MLLKKKGEVTPGEGEKSNNFGDCIMIFARGSSVTSPRLQVKMLS